MKRLLAILSLWILALFAAPGVFACTDCPDFQNCVESIDALTCEFFVDDGCIGTGWCPHGAAALSAEYRVAAVYVIESGKPLPNAQPKPAPVLTAAKTK